MKRSPTVIHIPHSSAEVPDAEYAHFVLARAEVDAEIGRMTDWFTDELFECPELGCSSVKYPVSRVVVDPERFENDEQEAMSHKGMGVIYTRTSRGNPLRGVVPPIERERLLNAYYRPHHLRFERVVAEQLAAHGWCLIIDAHSFPRVALPYENDPEADRPEYCIGADEFHTPQWLVDACAGSLVGSGRSVAINRPFSGTIVPASYYGKDKRVLSLMVEINRGIYMNEATIVRSSGFDAIRREMSKLTKKLTQSAKSCMEAGAESPRA